jgi:hypothetical protein
MPPHISRAQANQKVASPEAARSLRARLEETFTINRLDLPPSLDPCLAMTNIVEGPQAGVRKRTGNLCRWREGGMMLPVSVDLRRDIGGVRNVARFSDLRAGTRDIRKPYWDPDIAVNEFGF